MWVQFLGQIPWKRAWQPTTIVLSREFHGQKQVTYLTSNDIFRSLIYNCGFPGRIKHPPHILGKTNLFLHDQYY